jgi:hypothetical protein
VPITSPAASHYEHSGICSLCEQRDAKSSPQLSPTEFGKLITDETEKWGKVIRAAGIKPE